MTGPANLAGSGHDVSYDAVIVGAGQAGPPLAGRLAAAGMRVALVERQAIGGTCVNTGCTPTKALVASAYAAHLARRAGDYGVHVGGDVRVDFAAVMARARDIAARSRTGLERWLHGLERCTVVKGHARLEAPNVVRVGETRLTAPRIFLNVGGRARVPDLPGVDAVPFLTNTSVLALQDLPRHLVVVGGSYVGLEFAQIFRRLGAEVTVVEMGDRLIGREDDDISDAVTEVLAAEGIAIRTGSRCIGLAKQDDDVAVQVECADGPPLAVGSHVLLAVGRQPNTTDLGLADVGVQTDDRGYITVDDHLRTTVEGIWALGDCNGRGAFTHTAYNDFEIVAANLLDGDDRHLGQRVPCYALYTDPPLGRVGLGEREARARGHRVRTQTRPMRQVGRAVEKGETQGLMKVVVNEDDGAILGAAILGVGGDEAIHGVLTAINAGVTADAMRRAVAIHPTVSELIPTILAGALGR